MSQYRTVIGIVQFDPREGEAAGKPVRNITVNQAGFGQTAVRVSATLWPSHKNFAVAKNDVSARRTAVELRRQRHSDAQ